MEQKIRYFVMLSFVFGSCMLGSWNIFAQELDHFQKAEGFFQHGKYKEALGLYQLAVKTATENSSNLHQYYYQIARCYYQGRQAENSIQAAQKSITAKEDFVPAYVLLAQLYTKMQQPEQANEALESAFRHEKDPTQKASYMVRVMKTYVKQNKLTMALTKITEARNLTPNNLIINYYFAKISNELGKYHDAKTAMLSVEDSLKLMEQKESAKYYLELGWAYYYLKDAKNANETFEKAKYGTLVNQIPSPVTPQYLLSIANAYIRIHENEIGKQFIDSALRMNEAIPEAYIMQAQLAKRETDDPSVMVESLKTAATNENNLLKKVQFYDKIAAIQIDAQQYEACLQTLEQAMTLREDDPTAWFQKAVALYKMNRHEDAITSLLTILKVTEDPKAKASMQFLLGKVYAKNGQLELSQRAFQTALKSPSRNAAAIELRAVEIALKQQPKE